MQERILSSSQSTARRRLARLSVTGLLVASLASAQTVSFPKPNYFRQVFQQSHTQIDLREPSKLNDFLVGGKLSSRSSSSWNW